MPDFHVPYYIDSDTTPDHFYDMGDAAANECTTFIFMHNKLFVLPCPETHNDVIRYFHDEFAETAVKQGFEVLPESRRNYDYYAKLHRIIAGIGLEGRIKHARTSTAVAFWDSRSARSRLQVADNHLEMIKPCVLALLRKELITPEAFILIRGEVNRVSDIVGGQMIAGNKSSEENQKLRQIHLMNAGNKKRELLAMGASGRRSPWGLVPGQKHWSMHGEGFREWLLKL